MLLSRCFQRLRHSSTQQLSGLKVSSAVPKDIPISMENFVPERIRNFTIIAHIDHGKSTLADRLLEATGCIVNGSDGGKKGQVLDTLQVERERGITVKAQTASMIHQIGGETYLLNLIDTPGHADFSYEVSRSLGAVQGSLLLVDAVAGVQAQTISHHLRAREKGITAIIPVINKIDLEAARLDVVIDQIEGDLGIKGEIQLVSAKTGVGIDDLFEQIVKVIPPPPVASSSKPLRALLVDSWFEEFRGAVCLVSVLDGSLAVGQQVCGASAPEKVWQVEECGILQPNRIPTGVLYAGQVGYVLMGIKNAKDARVGDTLFRPEEPVAPIPGFKALKPTVSAGFFPAEKDQFEGLQSAIEKLLLNDGSVEVSPATSAFLGSGWRLGFLGTLHLDVFRQRLEQEFDANLIVTAPSVQYVALMIDGTRKTIDSVDEYPSQAELAKVKQFFEPVVAVTIVLPSAYTGAVMSLLTDHRGEHSGDISYIGSDRVRLKTTMPLAELIGRFNDRLLSITAGYSSLDYDYIYDDNDGGQKIRRMHPVDLVKVGIQLNGEPVDILGGLQPRSKAQVFGRAWTQKLASLLPAQQFQIAVQAVIGTKVIARETISAMRKDVTAKCYGGDKTRQAKLLEQQKEGKRRMKSFGKVEVPHEAFLEMIRLDSS